MNTFDKLAIVALRGLSLAHSGMDCIDLTQKRAAQ